MTKNNDPLDLHVIMLLYVCRGSWAYNVIIVRVLYLINKMLLTGTGGLLSSRLF